MKINRTFFVWLLVPAFLAAGLFHVYGVKAWAFWNIPTMTPSFVDARILTASAESYRLGFDPEIQNPQDPYNRLFNIPSVWKLFFLTELDQSHTEILAGVLMASFWLGFSILFSQSSRVSAGLLALCAFSPPVFLAFERGNVDLFVFFICALSIIWIERKPQLGALFLWLAATLKIFPIFSLVSLVYLRRKTFGKYAVFFLAGFALYSLLTLENFKHAFSNTEIGFDLSYGLGVLPYYVEMTGGGYALTLTVSLLSVITAISVMFFSFHCWNRNKASLAGNNLYILFAFRMGASIYIGTFLLGNNWDYRLIFLLFTLPQLVDWAAQSYMVKFTLISVVASLSYLWLAMFLPFAYFLDELSNWFVFAGLFYLMVISLPEWVKDDMQTFLARYKTKTV